MTRAKRYTLALGAAIVALAAANLIYGSVDIPAADVVRVVCGGEARKASWTFILRESRIPQTLTALWSGMALAASGLLLQTTFRNPLADPSILGISSGASLGVALVMLGSAGASAAGSLGLGQSVAIVGGAMAGACAVMALILGLATLIRHSVMLLIGGIMIGYVASSAISLLNFFATAEGVHSYLVWGMGNFGGVGRGQLPFFLSLTTAALVGALLLVKPLNALLLGPRYAENLGIRLRRTRLLLLGVTGALTAITTACCGPVSFIGLAVPHVARLLLGTANHNTLLPLTILAGGAVALLCNLLCILPGEAGIIPLNAVTPVIGAPVVLYVIINQRKLQYFNG